MCEERDSLGRFLEGRISGRRKNYVGMQFGLLTVISSEVRKDKAGKSRTYVTCKCQCGNTAVRKIDSLKTSNNANCGCKRKEIIQNACRKDLTGKRFGRLIVKEMLWEFHPTKCKCLCDCGNECVVIGTQLTYGKTQSCGCLHREITSIKNTKDFSSVQTKTGVRFIRPVTQNKSGVWIWDCQCKCGNIFQEIPAKVLNGHHTTCGCGSLSSGERIVSSILQKNNIPYLSQYSFSDCKREMSLRFDFAIFDEYDNLKGLIEYDGAQHYKPIEWFGGDEAFQLSKERDQIKDNYCQMKNIALLRLPYSLTEKELEKQIIKFCCESVETAGCAQ